MEMQGLIILVAKLLQEGKFRPFEKHDWCCYSGCESKEPMIAQHDGWDIIIDGDIIQAHYYSEEGDDYKCAQLSFQKIEG